MAPFVVVGSGVGSACDAAAKPDFRSVGRQRGKNVSTMPQDEWDDSPEKALLFPPYTSVWEKCSLRYPYDFPELNRDERI